MVVFVVWHGCMLVLQHTWCHGQSPPPPPLCVVAILCHHAMPPHPCHPHQTMSTGVQCVGVVPAVHTHLTNLFVACIAWWVLCGGVLVHTALDATPPVVHTMGCNALVCCHQCLCVVCLAFHCVHHHHHNHNLVAPLVCVWLVNNRPVLLLGCLLIDQLDHLVAPHPSFCLCCSLFVVQCVVQLVLQLVLFVLVLVVAPCLNHLHELWSMLHQVVPVLSCCITHVWCVRWCCLVTCG